MGWRWFYLELAGFSGVITKAMKKLRKFLLWGLIGGFRLSLLGRINILRPSCMSESAPPHAFPATIWSRVLRTRDEASARTALDQLCRIYWGPVLTYVRALGCPPDEAQDVAQEFFTAFLRRQGFQRAEQERGSLRSYLKTALRYHVIHWNRDRATQRRGGGVAALTLDEADLLTEPSGADASVRYDEEWALTVMRRALSALQDSFEKRGKAELYAVLMPTLLSTGAGESTDLAGSLGITRGTFAVEQHRARRRLAALLREEVAGTVVDPAETEEELLHLLRVLANTEVAP